MFTSEIPLNLCDKLFVFDGDECQGADINSQSIMALPAKFRIDGSASIDKVSLRSVHDGISV